MSQLSQCRNKEQIQHFHRTAKLLTPIPRDVQNCEAPDVSDVSDVSDFSDVRMSVMSRTVSRVDCERLSASVTRRPPPSTEGESETGTEPESD